MTDQERARIVADPMEDIIARALDAAGLDYARDYGGENPSGLDFRLANGVEIEVKRFHSPRIAGQMSRADNVIAIQGKEAVEFFSGLLVRAHIQSSPTREND